MNLRKIPKQKLLYCIYVIVNRLTGRMYFGFSFTLKERIKSHLKGVLNAEDAPLYNDIRFVGWKNFNVYIVEEFDSICMASDAERYWINLFHTNITKYGDEWGYNRTDGGLSDAYIKNFFDSKWCLKRLEKQNKPQKKHPWKVKKNKFQKTANDNAFKRPKWLDFIEDDGN